jgi:tetratricopeptide (TPR) repeat protein
MAMQGDYQKARRAMDALDQEASKADSPEGLRTRALVLAAQRSRPRRLEAVRLLEKATSDQLPPPENQFLLGQLYESVGDWRKAREQMLSLVTSNPDNPLYLARYVRGLLRHDGADEAEPWVSKLEKLQPDLFQTLELKARVLKARGKGQEVTELVKRYARRPDANLRRAASLLEQLDQAGDAEELYRRYRRESKAPDATLVLAEFLGRQKRLREALDLCDEARKALPVDAVAATALNILYVCGRDPEQNQRVRGWVKEEARKGPRRAFAVSCLAALHHMQGEYAEATRLFRAALELDPNDALALNNLAWLLALREGRGAEALELLRRAEESVGQLPDLLDTQAVVHLALNQGPEAVAILEDLVAEQPTALAYFHLARGYQLTRQTVAAKGAIRKAHEQGLKPADVDPLEREAYDRLLEELGTR